MAVVSSGPESSVMLVIHGLETCTRNLCNFIVQVDLYKFYERVLRL